MPDPARMAEALRNLRRAPEVISCVRSTERWPQLLAGYLGLRRPRFPLDLTLRSGGRLRLDEPGDLVTAWVIFCREEYWVDPECRTIIDAGANIGAFTVYAADRAKRARIVALEPYPTTFAHLEQTVRVNGLTGRVRLRRAALAAADGERRMQDDPERPSHKRALLDPADEAGAVVEARSLETLLAEEKLERVDLLKLDIEGAEHEVLLSTPDEVLQRIEAVALEYHPAEPKHPLFEKLTRTGLRLVDDRMVAINSGTAQFAR